MERFIADLVKNFESGKLSRREFCKTVALAATVYAAGDTAKRTGGGLKIIGVNHISYTCPDYTKARDWYLGPRHGDTPGKDNGKQTNLMFGPEPGKGGQFVVARTATPITRPPAQALVDHICYTISDWSDARVTPASRRAGAPLHHAAAT